MAPWNAGTTQSKPFSWCLAKGGTANRGDMVPPIPNLPPSTSNRKPWLNYNIPTEADKAKSETQEQDAIGTRDKREAGVARTPIRPT